jgi:hypothetical protein
VDDNDEGHESPKPALDQQRDLDDTDALPADPAAHDAPKNSAANSGVHDGIQRAAGMVVCEDDAAELGAVEGPIREEDGCAEVGDNLGEGAGVGLDDLAGEDVGVDDWEVVFFREEG